MTASTIGLRLLCAVAAGLVIGFDRGERGQPAGVRTTLLVCTAAALAMVLDLLSQAPDGHGPPVRLDLMRLPLGILSGMGFIGGGVIVRKGSLVRGVTTAATLWIVTVLGLCFGGGQLALGAAGTVIATLTLSLPKRVESLLVRGHRAEVLLEIHPGGPDEVTVAGWLREAGFSVHVRHVEIGVGSGEARMRFEGLYHGAFPDWSTQLLRSLSHRTGVRRIRWLDIG
jgi:putative Mg2+ transporter-C (MgtC) family protein